MKKLTNQLRRSILLAAVMLFAIATWAQDGWPVRFEADGRQYQLFAPQPESMSGNQFSARAAISMHRPQDKAPIFGAVWGDGKLELDRGSRLGSLIRFDVNDARFPGIDDQQELAQLRQALSTAIPMNAPPISIDWMIAALEEEQQAGDQYVNDAPEIIYRERPTTLVFIDGDPRYEAMDATVATQGDPLYQPQSRASLERVINTPFMILRKDGGDHFLYGSGIWFRSRQIDGPWRRDDNVPSDLQKLASQVDDAAALTADDRPTGATPDIVVRYTPAEMLAIDGRPEMQPVQNTSLLTVTNTTRSVFMDISSQDYYFLASGRWFRTRDLASGNWEFVPADRLPEEFKAIPEGSNRDMVLAHVAGTDAAREAARDAHIPQTAKVNRNSASVDVSYQGSPAFERIDGTNVEHARNANTEVFRINGYYHVCDNGVWFEGPTPDGPWTVSTVVPAEVQSIPPSSPAYNVRYVYIYDHTPEIVYMGYTPGYMGSFVQHGVVVYGTGFYYRPHPMFWRPRPWTWGMNMYYDPWIGWGFGYGWGYNWFHPYWGGMGMGMGMWGHPYGGWGGGWWGPYAWHPPCCVTTQNTHYGHRPSVSGARSSRSDSPGGVSQRMARTDNNLYAARERTGVDPSTIAASTRDQQTQQSRQEGVAPARRTDTRQADHFTDAAGNVYRQSGDRTQRYEDGSWNRVAPTPPADRGRQATQPQRDQQARPTTPERGGQQPQAQPDRRGQEQQTRPQPQTRPQQPQARPDPRQIQQDRQRGIQRQQNFQRNAPQRAAPAPPAGGGSPGRAAPAPSRSPGGVSPGGGGGRPGGGGGGAPSRGGGGGGGRGGR